MAMVCARLGSIAGCVARAGGARRGGTACATGITVGGKGSGSAGSVSLASGNLLVAGWPDEDSQP